MRTIYAHGKWLHYPPLELYYIQGEHNVEPVQLILPESQEGMDLTALTYQIKAVSESGTEAVQLLTKVITDHHVMLKWQITREFTAVPGRLTLMLTGSDGVNVVAKWTGYPINIRPDLQGAAPVPPPDEMEQYQQQIRVMIGEITATLEKAQKDLKEPIETLQKAQDTAATLIKKSEELSSIAQKMEFSTIPEFKAYAEESLKTLNAIRGDASVAAGVIAKSADTVFQAQSKVEQIYRSMADIQKGVTSDRKDVADRHRLVTETAEQVKKTAQQIDEGAQEAQTALSRVTELENSTLRAAESVKIAMQHAPRISDTQYWETWDTASQQYVSSGTRAHLVPRGKYNVSKTYYPEDVVFDPVTRSSYMALIESRAVPLSDTTTWMCLVESIKGEKGEAGKGLAVLGKFDTLESLQSSVAAPEPGDAYSVGTQPPYNVYTYSVKDGWVDQGRLNSRQTIYSVVVPSGLWKSEGNVFRTDIAVPGMVNDCIPICELEIDPTEPINTIRWKQKDFNKIFRVDTDTNKVIVRSLEGTTQDLKIRIAIVESSVGGQ